MWILPKQLHTSAYVPDTAALSLDLNESSQLCAQSLFVRSKPSPLRTWLQKWKRDSWTQHLYGRILKPSLGQSFVTAWTSSLEATPVSPSVQPGSDLEQTTQDIFGPTSQAAFDFFDQSSASSRMSRGTSALDSEKSLENWKNLVTKRRGEYSARLNAARLTSESACLSWPTASTRDHKGGYEGGRIRDGKISMDTLDVAVQAYTDGGLAAQGNHNTHGSRPESWLTPKANEPGADSNFVARNADRGEHCHVSLTMQAKAWATPRCSMAQDKQEDSGRHPESWRTPSAQIIEAKPGEIKLKNRKPEDPQVGLADQVKAWASPRTMTGGTCKNGAQHCDLNSQAGGKLNPRWVCVLMNLPVFWVKP